MKKFGFKRCFTLIELLIVITIIGILAAALLPSILGAPAAARDAERQSTVNKIVTAVEAYVANSGQPYPDSGFDGCISGLSAELAEFIPGGAMPTDPSGDRLANDGSGPGTDCSYYYCANTAAGRNYTVVAYLEDDSGGNHGDDDLTGSVCGNNVDLDGSGQYFVVIN